MPDKETMLWVAVLLVYCGMLAILVLQMLRSYKQRKLTAWLAKDRLSMAAELSRLRQSMDVAWGIIANAYGGNWEEASPVWKAAAEHWRDNHYRAYAELKSLERRGRAHEAGAWEKGEHKGEFEGDIEKGWLEGDEPHAPEQEEGEAA